MSKRFVKLTLLGNPGANRVPYLTVVVIVSLALAFVNHLLLPGGWWSLPGPTNGFIVAMLSIGAVAGYNQYGLASGVVATSLPLFALLVDGAYYTTTLGYPSPAPPTPIEHVSTSAILAIVPGVLVGVLGYALGYGARAVRDRVRSTPSGT